VGRENSSGILNKRCREETSIGVKLTVRHSRSSHILRPEKVRSLLTRTLEPTSQCSSEAQARFGVSAANLPAPL
jgi:hypothetical protein